MLEENCNDFISATSDKNAKNRFTGTFQTIWQQAAPLFERKYLKTTLIICATQFWLNAICNGLYLWFPYIENAIVEFMNSNPGENRMLCHIVYDNLDGLYDNETVRSLIT